MFKTERFLFNNQYPRSMSTVEQRKKIAEKLMESVGILGGVTVFDSLVHNGSVHIYMGMAIVSRYLRSSVDIPASETTNPN